MNDVLYEIDPRILVWNLQYMPTRTLPYHHPLAG
jgi:hypothetical protein